MNKHLTWIVVLALIITGFGFAACSDDDNTGSNDSDKDTTTKFVYDELAFLQSALVKVDSTGAFERRVLGVALDRTDTTCVSVGVDDYAEAKEIFRTLFSDTTAWNADSTVATFSVAKGSARLTRDGDAAGLVARAEFNVPGLKYVSAINFILNDAWPANAVKESDYVVGQTYEFTTWQRVTWVSSANGISSIHTVKVPAYKDDQGKEHGAADISTFENVKSEYVCIRPYKNGRPALLIQISHYKHKGPDNEYCRMSDFVPTVEKGMEISKVLRASWAFFDGAFTLENGKHLLNEGEYYWTSTQEVNFFSPDRQFDICLSSGKTDYWTYFWSKTQWRRVVFFKEMQ